MLIILFGLSGSGKNYVGSKLQNQFGYTFWDADEVLLDSMKECIKTQSQFTQQMCNDFTEVIIQEIEERLTFDSKLVIAQAFYREINRAMLSKRFPSSLWLHVKAPNSLIEQRLEQRGNWVGKSYAQRLRAAFESPLIPHEVIFNDSNEENVIKQLHAILDNLKPELK